MNADNVRRFVLAVVDAAIEDAKADVPERHETNSRQALVRRLNLGRFRVNPRHGDGAESRRIYIATRFLYRTETSE